MTVSETLEDRRFRQTVTAGEYTRCITVFLRLRHPEAKDLSTLPKDFIQEAQVYVDSAIFRRLGILKEMEEQFR